MQVGLEFSCSNKETQDALIKYLPVIRNEIVLILSTQKSEEMGTLYGKEKLMAELIDGVNIILSQRKIMNGINVYFTSFVMQ